MEQAGWGVYTTNGLAGDDQITGNYRYELTDHLGNIRAVIGKTSTGIPYVVARTDYYPFGMAMLGRNVEGSYRYKYKGQEKDPETGMEAFQLRLWDSRIGRWLTVDPYNQYYSPYLGMGNTPINGIDSDGGIFRPLTPQAAALWEKFKAIISTTDKGKAYIDAIEKDESFVVTIINSPAPNGSSVAYSTQSQTLYLSDKLTDKEIKMLAKDMADKKIHPHWINVGHEVSHIFLHYNFDKQYGPGAFYNHLFPGGRGNVSRILEVEKRVVHFQNYLYSATHDGDNFRNRYSGTQHN